MIRNALLALAALSALALAGCEIHLNPGGDSPPYDGCSPWGCDDVPLPGTPGGDCSSNYDCQAGCYCNEYSFCEETGFCEVGEQCADGFACDERSTCVPEGSDPGFCESDEDCPMGTYCFEEFNLCVSSQSCEGDDECGNGMMCDSSRNTCVPAPCTSNEECGEGCYCDFATGSCVEAGLCETDEQCADGLVCEVERNSCVPADSEPPFDPGSCEGEVLCDGLPPECGDDAFPGIADGCYTGACIPAADCEREPEPSCESLADEDICLERADCTATYVGVNCTCESGVNCNCSAEDSACVCERFDFSGCASL
ncbi:hypothetical protein [Haliangium ochraceum]|uniref:Uncharacterized protein n=1 Tax=Haliangium ochraceum (strain DSM 14365 / JCM 11303 / SMP-2) TaxID=502025 RepID=D0LXG9_HALO1|nr:hypothetical protein [Haliangium ochraceum]ACY17724.1 hypothetical protein Hoch_5239 [Haliangium ochraceum DSM 14365]